MGAAGGVEEGGREHQFGSASWGMASELGSEPVSRGFRLGSMWRGILEHAARKSWSYSGAAAARAKGRAHRKKLLRSEPDVS